jgi:hypothetical protein
VPEYQRVGESLYQDPMTGMIIDQETGEQWGSAEELLADSGNMISAYETGAGQQGGGGGMGGAGQAAGGAGSLISAYMLNQAMTGGAPEVAGTLAAGTSTTPTLLGAAPATPTGVTGSFGGTTGANTGLFGVTSPAALGAGAVAGTIAGHEMADKYGMDKPWALANAMNPINSVYSVADEFGSLKKGGNLSTSSQIATALPTMGASLLYNPVKKFFGSGKDGAQMDRDSYRAGAKDGGFFDDGKYGVNLSSGASLDWGKDGGARLQNAGANIDGKSDRGYYDVDFSRDDSAALTAALNPLGAILSGKGGKGMSDMTGYLVNTAQSKGDAFGNAKELYDRRGLDYNTARNLINELDADQATKDNLFNGLDETFGVNAYAGKGAAWEKKKPMQQSKPMASTAAPAPSAVKRDTVMAPVNRNPGRPIPWASQAQPKPPVKRNAGRPVPWGKG